MTTPNARLAPPCGLYCGICPDLGAGTCTGCTVQEPREDDCSIIACARSRKLETCAACPDLPCSVLVQFTVDPVWRTHLPCVENLRRQRAVGRDAWLREQAECWADERRRARWSALSTECDARFREERRTKVRQE